MSQTILYEVGTVRWRKHAGNKDVRACGLRGWDVEAMLIEFHPITGSQLKSSQWWLRETKRGDDA